MIVNEPWDTRAYLRIRTEMLTAAELSKPYIAYGSLGVGKTYLTDHCAATLVKIGRYFEHVRCRPSSTARGRAFLIDLLTQILAEQPGPGTTESQLHRIIGNELNTTPRVVIIDEGQRLSAFAAMALQNLADESPRTLWVVNGTNVLRKTILPELWSRAGARTHVPTLGDDEVSSVLVPRFERLQRFNSTALKEANHKCNGRMRAWLTALDKADLYGIDHDDSAGFVRLLDRIRSTDE